MESKIFKIDLLGEDESAQTFVLKNKVGEKLFALVPTANGEYILEGKDTYRIGISQSSGDLYIELHNGQILVSSIKVSKLSSMFARNTGTYKFRLFTNYHDSKAGIMAETNLLLNGKNYHWRPANNLVDSDEKGIIVDRKISASEEYKLLSIYFSVSGYMLSFNPDMRHLFSAVLKVKNEELAEETALIALYFTLVGYSNLRINKGVYMQTTAYQIAAVVFLVIIGIVFLLR